jgi:N-acetylglucosamine-6-phosphate deacetylase
VSSPLKYFFNGTLITDAGTVRDGAVLVREGRIEAAGERGGAPAEAELIDAGGGHIAPGFIDLHVHGGGGGDFMDATREDVERVFRFHAAHGTTALCPSTCAAPLDEILAAIAAIDGYRSRGRRFGRALGAHIEGPYLNLSKKGCHLAEYVRDPDEAEWSRMLAAGPVSAMTLAPELPGARPLVEALRRNGSNASAGHSEALYHEVREAMGWGVNHVTHLFCAMSGAMNNRWRLQPFLPRAGGLLEAALLEEGLTSEVISDGKHLPREMLLVAFRLMGYERLAIVTDAMRGAGMPDGEYPFGPRNGLVAVVRDGEARVPDGTALASSVCGMNQMVRVFHQLTGCPLWQAVRMGSLTPARILGVSDELGSLAKGKQADIVLLDDRLDVTATYVAGELVR